MSETTGKGVMVLDRLRPTWENLVDIAFAVVLASLGVVGFDASFGGPEAFTIGIPGVVCGVAVGYLLAKLRIPLLAGAAVGLVGFFLLGGLVALRTDAIAGFLPSSEVWSGLIDGSINGWVRLLTTVPPAGQAGNLLAIPYLAGYLGGLLTVVAAVMVKRWPLCLVPPVSVLAVSVLFGVDKPASLILQGVLFGAATVGWLCLRAVRSDRPSVTHARTGRLAGGVALLAVAGLAAFIVGPNLPFAGARERYVLRDRVEPPFDPSQYPSPLARFRAFHGEDPIKGTLFTVKGLPADSVVRFAVMDSYDGYVWKASAPGTATGGTYRRVGDRIDGAAEGKKATVSFEMGELANSDSVWIPTVGSPTGISFSDKRGEKFTEEFRFNRTTEAAASPLVLRKGDRWEVKTVVAEAISEDRLRKLPIDSSASAFAPPNITDTITALVAEWTAEAANPYDRVVALEKKLIDIGAYNDGSKERPVPPGHSLGRLIPFLEDKQPEGNGEQYAAAVAYLAEHLGIPARVVLEFDPVDRKGVIEVKADDARASVEIALEGVGWVRVGNPTPDKSDEPEPQVKQRQERPTNEVQPPPPSSVAPNGSLFDEAPPEETKPEKDAAAEGGAGLLMAVVRGLGLTLGVIAILATPALIVIWLKVQRRKRRRGLGSPAQRVAAGWMEVVDLARDLGTPVPPKATRREISRFVPAPGVTALVEEIDATVFGHEEPSDEIAVSIWQRVDDVRLGMMAEKGRGERLRTAVSLTSLRGGR